MRHVFIDAGAYTGDSLAWFKAHFQGANEFELFAFEPNPDLAHHYADLHDVTFINKAVWVHNEPVQFFIGKDNGSTLLTSKTSGDIHSKPAVYVPAIDFSEWLLANFEKEDFIILKMDIEGAEFTVIPDMIDSGAMLLVNELWCELHPNKIPEYTTKYANELKNTVINSGVTFKDWH